MKRSLSSVLSAMALLCAATVHLAAAPLAISEFVADNNSGLLDEDATYQDWIEIYNPGPTSVDLANYSLTDDAANPAKWVFPTRTILTGERLIVFASNKNRKPASPANLHTNFKLDNDAGYLALVSPTGDVLTGFSPTYPRQDKDTSYGTGYSGTLTLTNLTPTALVPGTNYGRVKLTGSGTATVDQSLNSFDDSLSSAEHQQYLWYDYSSGLSQVPAGQTIVSARLEWEGNAQIFAGVSNLGCVPSKIGVFACPDANKGISTLGTGNSTALTAYYGANQPASEVTSTPGTTKLYSWDVTTLVNQWKAAPGAPQAGQFMILNSAQPHWVAWNQNSRGPKLVIQSTATPLLVTGYMGAPTPGSINSAATPAGPLMQQVADQIATPAAGTSILVTAKISPFQGGVVTNATLHYRRMYETEQTLLMLDSGTAGDVTAGDVIYSALIPGSFAEAGKMLRWFITTSDAAGYSTRLPTYRFPTDSAQYYGTVPTDPSVVSNIPVLQWFVQDANAAATIAGTRASFYYLNEFYDNVEMNLHGQSTQGAAFTKKSYNLGFNRGERFRWDPAPGSTAPRVKNINLLTNFADKTKMRHDIAYEIFRTSGTPAHFCFTTRVQRNGVFNGTYDFVEDGDDIFLERAGLNKDGALYKMYNNMSDLNGSVFQDHSTVGAEKKNRKAENNLDLRTFLTGLNQTNAVSRRLFLYDNVNIPAMINFMAANSITGNIDLHAKNYYVYRDTGITNEWTLLPWDLDLSLGRLWNSVNTYFDDGLYENPNGMGLLTGQGQNLIAKLYAIPELATMAKRRIRSLNDIYIQQNSVAPATRWFENKVKTLQDLMGADATLDYNFYQPVANWMNPGVATASPYKAYTVAQELDRVRGPNFTDDVNSYIYKRRAYVYGDANMPPAQDAVTPPAITIGAVEYSPASGDQDQEYIEISNANAVAVDISNWKLTDAVDFTFLPGTVIAPNSKLYVSPNVASFRARSVSPKANEGNLAVGPYGGHLSNLGETINLKDQNSVLRATKAYVGTATDWQKFLVLSEILYKPSGTGLAEYIELQNISPSVTLNLAGVKFTVGVEFDFTGKAITSLLPGAKVLVARNQAAFDLAFGAGKPVAGEFANLTALANDGETLKLEDPLGNTIAEISYKDAAPWPTLADNFYSMVLIRPDLDPLTYSVADPARWRASAQLGGTPGMAEDAAHFTGSPTGDQDGDGLSNLVEYVLGTSQTNGDSAGSSMSMSVVSTPAGAALDLQILVNPMADDAKWRLELSTDLAAANWSAVAATMVGEVRQPDGRSLQTWRVTDAAAAAGNRKFARVTVESR